MQFTMQLVMHVLEGGPPHEQQYQHTSPQSQLPYAAAGFIQSGAKMPSEEAGGSGATSIRARSIPAIIESVLLAVPGRLFHVKLHPQLAEVNNNLLSRQQDYGQVPGLAR